MTTTYNNKGMQELVRRLQRLSNDPYVKVGILASAGQHNASEGVRVVDVAAANEFGTDRIPERAFMRISARKMEKDIHKMMEAVFYRVADGKLSIRQAMNLVGKRGVRWIQKTIVEGVPPPNAPSTIARKGSSTPLIDTSQMYQSINYEVVT